MRIVWKDLKNKPSTNDIAEWIPRDSPDSEVYTSSRLSSSSPKIQIIHQSLWQFTHLQIFIRIFFNWFPMIADTVERAINTRVISGDTNSAHWEYLTHYFVHSIFTRKSSRWGRKKVIETRMKMPFISSYWLNHSLDWRNNEMNYFDKLIQLARINIRMRYSFSWSNNPIQWTI
jgi:hypothetical protein